MKIKNNLNDDILRINNLSVSYKIQGTENMVLQNFSMSIKRGETVCVTGYSGVGKSTLAMAIMGLSNADKTVVTGEIFFDGQRIDNLTYNRLRQAVKNRMSLMCQDSNTGLDPFMKVGRQIIEVLTVNFKIPKAEARARAVLLLKQLGFDNPEELYGCYPHELSGGMRQRAALAMAVICEPDFLILDEPTSEVDLATERAVLDFIKLKKEEYGMTVLLITHKNSVINAMADRVIDLERLSDEDTAEQAENGNGAFYEQ